MLVALDATTVEDAINDTAYVASVQQEIEALLLVQIISFVWIADAQIFTVIAINAHN